MRKKKKKAEFCTTTRCCICPWGDQQLRENYSSLARKKNLTKLFAAHGIFGSLEIFHISSPIMTATENNFIL